MQNDDSLAAALQRFGDACRELVDAIAEAVVQFMDHVAQVIWPNIVAGFMRAFPFPLPRRNHSPMMRAKLGRALRLARTYTMQR